MGYTHVQGIFMTLLLHTASREHSWCWCLESKFSETEEDDKKEVARTQGCSQTCPLLP